MNVIEVKNLKKAYGEKIAVNQLNLTIKKGTIFGLLGANGAGKSTSIDCILGIKIYNEGEVRILGMNPFKDRKKIFSKVGIQFQDCAHQSTILVKELCEMTACVYRKPQDYKVLLSQFSLLDKQKQKVSSLSGGERQRLFIVLALIPNPDVVILDELTTGLDTIARKEVWKYLLKLKETGLSILLTSHFMDEIEKLCDQILILKKGETVFQGNIQGAISLSKQKNFEEAYEWFIQEEVKNESI